MATKPSIKLGLDLDDKRLPQAAQAALAALKTHLHQKLECSPDQQVSVYGSCATDYNLYRLIELSVHTPTGGYSFQRSNPDALGLLAACEDFLESFYIEPTRPQGWNEDLDIHADAVHSLDTVIDDHHLIRDDDE